MAKLIRVRDLRDGDNGAGKPSLHCTGDCGGVFSADAGDYFAARPDTILKRCGAPMIRLLASTTYKEA